MAQVQGCLAVAQRCLLQPGGLLSVHLEAQVLLGSEQGLLLLRLLLEAAKDHALVVAVEQGQLMKQLLGVDVGGRGGGGREEALGGSVAGREALLVELLGRGRLELLLELLLLLESGQLLLLLLMG